MNKSNDYFYRVTVLNNVGYKAFQDPFTMTLDPDDKKIYISDRNVGIHEMDIDAVGLYGEQPFFMENNYLPYYDGSTLTYGAIGAGMMKRNVDIIDKNVATQKQMTASIIESLDDMSKIAGEAKKQMEEQLRHMDHISSDSSKISDSISTLSGISEETTAEASTTFELVSDSVGKMGELTGEVQAILEVLK